MPDPPTEPFSPLDAVPPARPVDNSVVKPDPVKSAAPAHPAFSHVRYRFTTGLPPSEVAHIRSAEGAVLLSYRSFASIVGVVAALVSGIVVVAGVAASLFLLAEAWPLRAAAVLALTLGFAFVIALLVPRVDVNLYDENHPALSIAQRSTFPSASYVVSTPNGATLAELRKSFLSRLGRNRWTIWHAGRLMGEAAEESLGRAMLRKLFGKFNRRSESNVLVTHGGIEVARIIRRPDDSGRVDELELTSDALDRRLLVALATLILGREP